MLSDTTWFAKCAGTAAHLLVCCSLSGLSAVVKADRMSAGSPSILERVNEDREGQSYFRTRPKNTGLSSTRMGDRTLLLSRPADRSHRPADARLAGTWRGLAVDKPGEGTSRDKLTMELNVSAKGQLSGKASGDFVDDGECELKNVHVNGPRFEAEISHRTGMLMRITMRLQNGELRGEAVPILWDEGRCDIDLQSQDHGKTAGRHSETQPDCDFAGVWEGVAMDKPEDGTSRDKLRLELSIKEDGHLTGRVEGQFVAEDEAALQNVRVKGDMFEAELAHRTGVAMRIALQLADHDRLKGEGIPVLSDEDRCDILLHRKTLSPVSIDRRKTDVPVTNLERR